MCARQNEKVSFFYAENGKMNDVIRQMIQRYKCQTESDWINALREVMQEIALQGLARGKFFDKAAFYGGTALRIMYGLNRGSEDLDFSLLKPDESFSISDYADCLKDELKSMGFSAAFAAKEKSFDSPIDSALLKMNTKAQLISIGVPKALSNKIHSKKELKIKLEVDTNPPTGFETEVKTLFRPIPHAVRVYTLPDLAAGKLHAVLCRKWRNRSKGRDWYDMVWYAGNHPTVNLSHLEQRMRQSGDYAENSPLTHEKLMILLMEAVNSVDIDALKHDVTPFIADKSELDLWSRPFFSEAVKLFNPA